MHITLRQLRYFVEIARSQSFSLAAKRLLIAQPALSQNISTLERQLGAKLLERHTRGVNLTPAGERILAGAQDMLSRADALGELAADEPQTPTGSVHLAVAGSLSSLMVGPLLRTMAEQYPGIKLTIQEGLSFDVRTEVESGRSQLALMPSPSEIPGMASRSLFEERFMLLGAPKSMQRKPKIMKFAHVVNLPLALPDGAHDLRKIVERGANVLNCCLDVRYELNSPQMLLAVAKEGLAYAIMPPSACLDAIEAKSVIGCAIADPELRRVQAVVWARNRPLSQAAQIVSTSIQTVTQALMQQGKLPGRLVNEKP